MNKELKELLDKINAKKSEVKNLVNENKVDEAKAAKEELINLQAKFDVLYDLEDEAKAEVEEKIEAKEVKEISDKKDSVKEFANAARNGFKVNNQMQIAGTGAEGGYTVPEDILTRIEKYREAKRSLRDLVRVVPVTTYKGQRTFKARGQQDGFQVVGEGAAIGKKATPQFTRLAYEIKKYAGYFPVTNELLADSDANITQELVEWIGDESRVTSNRLILEKIKEKFTTPTDLKNLNGIKEALNVTLGQAFKNTSKIITNDDGLHYLDSLTTSIGSYIIQPNQNNPMELRLTAGATTIPVEVIPNSDLPTDVNKIPFIIGDLNEGIVLWDRQQLSIMASNIASVTDFNAFEEDLTLFRAIEREDVTIRDEKAIVYGYITKK